MTLRDWILELCRRVTSFNSSEDWYIRLAPDVYNLIVGTGAIETSEASIRTAFGNVRLLRASDLECGTGCFGTRVVEKAPV